MFEITRNISVSGCGMPIMPMGGCCMPAMPMCTPIPMVGGYYGGISNNDMAAGYCVGAALSNPGIMNALGTGLKWGYNNVIKPVIGYAGKALNWGWNNIALPVYNGFIKPVGQFLWNDVIKPVGKGLKWIWDHTLGWVLKKIGGSSDSKKTAKTNQGTELAVDTPSDTVKEYDA